MLFRKDVFTELKLSIEDYEFPNLENEPWDSDWLNVKIRVKHPEGSWKAIGACLTAFELERLIEWFEKAAEGAEVEKYLSFTEPCLKFEIVKKEPGTLRIFFSYELAPPWIKTYEEEFFIDFVVTGKELKRAAEDLRKELGKFPVRVGL
ncbi:MAG: hypothetical protein M3384_15010 [Acidobacteriota bacterium]|nr:hypothetical protein [Acidobacteriota bacterium]